MDLRIEPVTEKNRAQMLSLRLLPEQSGFIEPVEQCLKEAEGLAAWRPVAIYAGETLVGFAMYGHFEEAPSPPGRVWLDRLLIDCRYQGKGYGRAAVETLLARLRGEYACQKVYLSVYQENVAATRLYEEMGFRFTGELDGGGELVMAYTF